MSYGSMKSYLFVSDFDQTLTFKRFGLRALRNSMGIRDRGV